MKQGTVSIRYSTRRMSDGYSVAAVAEDGEVLWALNRLNSHGKALHYAKKMAKQYNLPVVDQTPTEPALTNQQDWQETVNRLND